MEAQRRCTACGKTKDQSEFYATKVACKECCKQRNLMSRYGITTEQYEERLAIQRGECAICGEVAYVGGREFHVDHCHDSHDLRGILCSRCNTGLGHFRDSVKVLQAAIEYLEGPNWVSRREGEGI